MKHHTQYEPRLALAIYLSTVARVSHFQTDFNQRPWEELGFVTSVRSHQVVSIGYTA